MKEPGRLSLRKTQGQGLGHQPGARRLAEAAGGQELLAGEPVGIVGGQEGGDGGDVGGLAGSTQGGLLYEFLLEVGADEAGADSAFGFDDAGVDGVHADFLGSEFAGEDAGDGVNRPLGCSVDGAVGRREAGYAGADVDDACAFTEMLDGCLGGEQETEDVDVEQFVE